MGLLQPGRPCRRRGRRGGARGSARAFSRRPGAWPRLHGTSRSAGGTLGDITIAACWRAHGRQHHLPHLRRQRGRGAKSLARISTSTPIPPASAMMAVTRSRSLMLAAKLDRIAAASRPRNAGGAAAIATSRTLHWRQGDRQAATAVSARRRLPRQHPELLGEPVGAARVAAVRRGFRVRWLCRSALSRSNILSRAPPRRAKRGTAATG